MEPLLEYLFVFAVCAVFGWWLEVVYRTYRHRKVPNPGFLTGCYLPLYGVGGSILYFLSDLRLPHLPSEWMRVVVILLLSAAVMTLIELIGGLISVNYFRVRLWDYSGEWKNYKGVICPKFSLYWSLIAAIFFFVGYPLLHRPASSVVLYPAVILALGAFAGIFTVDLVHSLRLMHRIRGYAARMKTLVRIDQLKANAREYVMRESGRRRPFNFYGMVGRYMAEMQDYRDHIQHRWGDKR